MTKSGTELNLEEINRIIQINQIHTYSTLTKNFEIEKTIHC